MIIQKPYLKGYQSTSCPTNENNWTVGKVIFQLKESKYVQLKSN